MKPFHLLASHDYAPADPLGARIARRLTAGLKSYLSRRRLRATVHTLQALDDRTLHDIGLDRSEIERAVRGTSDRRRSRSVDAWPRS